METPILAPLSCYEQTTMAKDPLLYSETPWLRGEYVTVVHIWLRYVREDRYVPGGVSERALGSYESHQRVVIPRSGLTAPMGQWSVGHWLRGRFYRRGPRWQWISHIFDKLSLLQGPEIARELNLGLWRGRSADEAYYATELADVRGLLEIWSAHGVTVGFHEGQIL